MPTVLRIRTWIFLASAVVLVQGTYAGYAHGQVKTQVEVLGLELSPVSVLGCQQDSVIECPDGVAIGLGFAATLRIANIQWKNAYWTVVEVGFGVHPKNVAHGFLGTEFGLAVKTKRNRLNVGVGLAAGGLLAQGDYNDATVNNGPLLWMPTVRYSAHVYEKISVGGGVRAILGTAPSDGAVLLFFLDLGVWN